MSEETSLDHDQTGPKTSPEPHRRIADPHRRITINILEILELPIFAYHTYYTSKHMYNWMKWLRLLGGWHFIAATAIKPPKAACQFAADDILLYKICYNIQWIYFTIWEKGKEELSPLQYHFKSLHIISRHYKKSLLRSQIYHGYEELSTDTNYPIWRRQKLPYMKKTRKKKQVCGAACFMAAEIKFSEDVRPSVRSSVRPTVSTKKHRCKWRIFLKFCTQVCLGVPSINLLFVLSCLIKYAHNSIISDFNIFGIHRVIF